MNRDHTFRFPSLSAAAAFLIIAVGSFLGDSGYLIPFAVALLLSDPG